MRRRGTPEQVEAARVALTSLMQVTWEQDQAMERRAEELGIPLKEYTEGGPSEEYERANAAAGEALSRIAWWQEWIVYDQVAANDPHTPKSKWRKNR